jgi:hypothetical protein
MTGRGSHAVATQIGESRSFVERALLDFGLLEAFEYRPARERAQCLIWIAASSDSSELEDRVSWLLDALSSGEPLVPHKDRFGGPL